MSLAIRNCNPGNIRYSKSVKWKGLIGENKGFCVFMNMELGVRAMILLLKRYINVYQLSSVEEIVSRYAPDNENNTCGYISIVSDSLVLFGLDPSDIKYKSEAFYRLVCTMIKVESGTYFFSVDQLKYIVSLYKL